MGLELGTFEIKDAVLGSRTELNAGVLSINAGELRAKLLEEGDFEDVEVEIIRPNEEVRLIHVIDAVEPRLRVSEPGSDFPGMLGPPRRVGRGRTHRLNGVVVTEVAPPVPGEPTYRREAIVDMAGEGAKYSPLSGLINVVLSFRPKQEKSATAGESLENVFEGTSEAGEYNHAIRIAGLKAAVYLAEVTRGQQPDRVDVYDLDHADHGKLPKVIYFYQMKSPYVYGEVAPSGGAIGRGAHLPTLIHPNEILDGAIVNYSCMTACMREVTYLLQNHALIHELYAHHGKDLDFMGVVLYTNGDSVWTKERISSYAANLAVTLGADGAILMCHGGGHPFVDVMMTCQKLEQDGVKTTLLLMEMAANPEDSGFVHYVREADAIVSTGNYEQMIDLAPMAKVCGGSEILETGDKASGPLNVPLRSILGSTHQFGGSYLQGRTY